MSSNVKQLLKIGQPDEVAIWPDYPSSFNLTDKDIDALVEMLTDPVLADVDPESPAAWAPLHACRALGQLRAVAAVPVMIHQFDNWEDSEWAMEEVPQALGLIGETAIAPLHTCFADVAANESSRMMAMLSLVEIARRYPAAENNILTLFAAYLIQPDADARVLNGLLVLQLAEFNATELWNVIEPLFENGLVDPDVVDLEDAEMAFGQRTERDIQHDDDSEESDDPLDILDDYLARYGTDASIQNVSELDGFFAAVACAPDVLMPSQWLPALWGGEDFMPDWEEREDIEEFHNLIMQIYNGVLDELMADVYSPLFYEGEFQGQTLLLVDDWCRGFLRGAAMYGSLSEADAFVVDQYIEPIRMFDVPANLEVLAQLSVEQITSLQEQLDPNVNALFQHFLKARVAAAHTPFVTTEPSVGRNDLCPCGSGKKFKKCCLH